MDRRGFLRFLGLGAASVMAAPLIKPKSFFSFFGTGEIWKPPPVMSVRLEGSNDMMNWVGISGIDFLDVTPRSEASGPLDALMTLTKDDIMDLRTVHLRYVRIAADSPEVVLSPAKPQFFLAS